MKISATTKTWLEDICDFYQRQNCSTSPTMLSFSQRVMKIKIEVFLPTLASIILSYYSYFWEWNDNFSCSQSEIVIFNFHLFFFCFPHLVNYHLLGALPPKSLPGLAATIWFHSSGVSPGLQWGEADTVISGSQMRNLYSLYSPSS